MAEGEGFTRTIASDTGPDAPSMTIRYERWTSPQLQVVLLSKMSDERNGERIVKLKDIQRAEPDPGLFKVPSDFTIQDVKGAFEILFTMKR